MGKVRTTKLQGPAGSNKTRKGLICWTGVCFGTASNMLSKIDLVELCVRKPASLVARGVSGTVDTTKNILAGSGSKSTGLEGLRASLFRELVQVCKISKEQGSAVYAWDSLSEKAEEIRQTILERDPKRKHRTIGIHRIKRVNKNMHLKPDEHTLRKIQLSIEKFGLINPPIVRKIKKGFELVSGYLRHEACKRTGVREIAVMVTELRDSEATELALLDPLGRNGQDHAEPAWLDSILRFYNEMLG